MHDKTIKNDDLTQLSDSLRVLPVQVGTRVEVPKSVPWAAGGEPIITPRTAQLGSIALQDFDENDQWQYMIEGKVWPYEDGDITFLPPAVAAKLPGPDLNCDKVNVLPVETARAIRQNKNIKGVISFDHLGSISDSVAEELAGCDVKILSLNGLKKLSPTAAKALATFRGEDLYLRGVQSLSTEAAQALSDCEIWHVMLGLTALTADEAEGIGRSHIKLLTLSNLTVLTPEAARGISHFKGSRLALAEVTGLSPEAAAHLATLDPNVELYLANLAAMHVEVAKAFHRFKGYLLCPAVEAMTPEAARALCKCEGANLYFVNVDFSSFPSEVQEWLNDPLRNKAKIQFHGKVFCPAIQEKP
ncbi:hypothetical protein EXS70_00445 [Candidatus Peribacteria bacterium]|nr:hypothetical protein [Candidatus Peribacteria bacterium]